MDNTLLERNLAHMAKRFPALAARISRTRGDRTYAGIKTARNGSPVPIAASGTAYNSLYDPEREAVQTISAITSPAFCLFAGTGGAFHIREFVRRFPGSPCVLAESGYPAFRSLLETVDIRDLVDNPDIFLIPDCSSTDEMSLISRLYLPSLHGDFRLIPLRSWQDAHKDECRTLEALAQTELAKVSADYSVQAHFGRVWLRNCLVNLRTASEHQGTLPAFGRPRAAIVAAAGPGLEDSIGEMLRTRSRADRPVLVSTDTAFGTLMDSGLEPEVFVSIDAQSVSSAHVMHNLPPSMTVILDICGNPDIARRAVDCGCNLVFTAGGHPLARHAAGYSRLPVLDTSSGTVTIAAMHAAHALGCTGVSVAGADYAYTGGKPYARGTYLADLFGDASSRLVPAESRYAALMFRTPVTREISAGRISYRTETLDRYAAASRAFVPPAPWTAADFCLFPANDFFAEYLDALALLKSGQNRRGPVIGTLLPFLAWYGRQSRYGIASSGTASRTAGGIELALDLIAGYTAIS